MRNLALLGLHHAQPRRAGWLVLTIGLFMTAAAAGDSGVTAGVKTTPAAPAPAAPAAPAALAPAAPAASLAPATPAASLAPATPAAALAPAAPAAALAPAAPAAALAPVASDAPSVAVAETVPSPVLPPSLPPPPFYPGPAVPAPPAGPSAASPAAAAGPPTPAAPSKPPALRQRVPRAGGISIGWTYTPSNNLPLSDGTSVYTPSGVDLDARFGWQIGGLNGGWPSWVGFMAGFFYYVGDQGINDSLGIDYGIFVKHGLFPGRRVRLFISYGLGAAQVWVKGVGGHGIGHDTRLSAGFDTRLSPHVHLTVEFAYKFIMLPYFAVGDNAAPDYSFQALNLLAGLWFGN